MLILGEGGSKDGKKARELYEQACEGGDMGACHGLALALEKGLGGKRDKKGAKELSQQACDGGFEPACPKE
jgi:hypothetical protein